MASVVTDDTESSYENGDNFDGQIHYIPNRTLPIVTLTPSNACPIQGARSQIIQRKMDYRNMPVYYVQVFHYNTDHRQGNAKTADTQTVSENFEEVQVPLEKILHFVSPAELEHFEHSLFLKERMEQDEKERLERESRLLKGRRGRPPRAVKELADLTKGTENARKMTPLSPSIESPKSAQGSVRSFDTAHDRPIRRHAMLATMKLKKNGGADHDSRSSTSDSIDELITAPSSKLISRLRRTASDVISQNKDSSTRPHKRARSSKRSDANLPIRRAAINSGVSRKKSPIMGNTIIVGGTPNPPAPVPENKVVRPRVEEMHPGMEDSEADDSVEYEVEYIQQHQKANGQMWYFVKWIGFPIEENTWLVEKDLHGAVTMVERYKKQHGLWR